MSSLRGRTFIFTFVEFDEVSVGLFLQPVEGVPSNSSPVPLPCWELVLFAKVLRACAVFRLQIEALNNISPSNDP